MKLKFSANEALIHIFSIIIMLMAAYYYLERTLPFDGAFYSFRISETKWFCIDNYRYGVEHTQLLPLLLVKAGCSLKTFLISYSISFALCNYIICLIILYVYKNPKMALGLLLATVLSYMYKFYYPVSEIHSTTGPLFLFAAHIFHFPNRKKNIVYFFFATIYIVWFLFIHVISIIPAFYVLTYYFAHSKSFKKNVSILLFSGLLLVLVFMLSKTYLTTEYLRSKMIGLKELTTFLSNPKAAPGYVYFKNEFLMNYLPLELLSISCLVFLLLKKEYLQAITLVTFTIGTWFIIMAYNLKTDAPIVYMNYYGLFGFYCVFPFCLYVIDYISAKKYTAIYSLLIICSLFGIIRSGALMSDQINFSKRITANMKTPKGIVSSANVDWESVWGAWDLSFQSFLVSSIQNPNQAKTFFNTDDTAIVKKCNLLVDTNSFFNTFFSPGWFRPPFANKKLYAIPYSTYAYLNTLQDNSFNDSILSNKNIEILADNETVYLLKNNYRTLPISIINHTSNVIPSIPSGIKQIDLCYHVLDSEGKIIFHDGRRSNFEMDILAGQSLTTGLSIDCTQLHRGKTYFLDIDIVIENKHWLNINKRVKIILI